MAANIGSFLSQFDVRPTADSYRSPKAKAKPEKPDKPAPEPPSREIKDTVSISAKRSEAEEGLSDKAKELLGKLRKQYGDYGFAVAGNETEFSTMRGVGGKEYSVIFTADELEKMAEDEDYAEEQMKQVENLIDMSRKLENDEEFQAKLDELAEKGYVLQNLSITPNAEGGVDVFAELTKVNEMQAERIEEKRAEAKAERTKDAEEAEKEAIAKKFEAPMPPKRALIKASSIEDLMSKIKGFDDESLEALMSGPAPKIDFSV